MKQYIEIPVWRDGAPDSNGLVGEEKSLDSGFITNVTYPVLCVYPAENPSGKAIVMCPGGGLTRVALGHEGHDLAPWFNSLGITFAILKYRMPNGNRNVLLNDIQQSLCVMKNFREKWSFEQLGVMGASIGGYIAASASVFFTPETHPDFQILFYPVITMEDSFTHLNSRKLILGDHPSEEDILKYSVDQHVTQDTPPAFIALATDDPVVSPENSICYYQALLWSKVSASVHIYPQGGHSFALKETFPYKRELLCELRRWLLA